MSTTQKNKFLLTRRHRVGSDGYGAKLALTFLAEAKAVLQTACASLKARRIEYPVSRTRVSRGRTVQLRQDSGHQTAALASAAYHAPAHFGRRANYAALAPRSELAIDVAAHWRLSSFSMSDKSSAEQAID